MCKRTKRDNIIPAHIFNTGDLENSYIENKSNLIS